MTVFEEMSQPQQHQVFMRARDQGLCEMTYTGGWQLTRDGRAFLDVFDALRSIDDRVGAAHSSSPLAAGSEQAAPQRGDAPRSAGRGDDRPTARGARGKRT